MRDWHRPAADWRGRHRLGSLLDPLSHQHTRWVPLQFFAYIWRLCPFRLVLSRLDLSLVTPSGMRATDRSSPSSALLCATTSIFLQLLPTSPSPDILSRYPLVVELFPLWPCGIHYGACLPLRLVLPVHKWNRTRRRNRWTGHPHKSRQERTSLEPQDAVSVADVAVCSYAPPGLLALSYK